MTFNSFETHPYHYSTWLCVDKSALSRDPEAKPADGANTFSLSVLNAPRSHELPPTIDERDLALGVLGIGQLFTR